MPPKHDAGTATRHYRAFWQRRCRAAATEAVLKPLGGNCAVLPKHYKIKAFRDSVTRSVKIYGLYILIYIIHSQISRNSCHALYSFFEPRHARRSTFIIHSLFIIFHSLFFIYSFNSSLLTPNCFRFSAVKPAKTCTVFLCLYTLFSACRIGYNVCIQGQ